MRGDRIIPTRKSETASDVRIFVDVVTLRPGFHRTNNTNPFVTEAKTEIEINITPNIVVKGGSSEDIRVEQFIFLQHLHL